MLKQRLWTVIISIPVLLVAIWFLPMPWFAIFIAGVMAWAAWEWSLFLGITTTPWRVGYMIFIGVMLVVTYFLPISWILIVALLVWLWALAAIICYQYGLKPLGFQYPWVMGIMGALALAPCWLSVNVLREDIGGPVWLLFALVLIWAMDTGSYIAGSLWGKHKLILRVSPNKTWEGLGGGIVLALVLAFVVCLAARVPWVRFVTICFMALVTALFAALGDLFESMLKRQAGIKDSGGGLPGHGGILDRIDSVVAALPIFTLASLWLNRFL